MESIFLTENMKEFWRCAKEAKYGEECESDVPKEKNWPELESFPVFHEPLSSEYEENVNC